ncbi:uncharacterized protein Z520_07631 [Fonsecaea multimorphosa CBS 102226]|uniref:25S rRNA adenine-N(1) methyltransferase n=1 Tax=Fonsecaea multimorphosa CBS 102226 TaxID=1442371 RepID=A0A0D2IIV6_9EURO|nr:uncharacterized protein Z520_07631 [Fonsecaea multimorphosa CBS 102226]KIX96911.1 hypothetical protein Z520_07631 [Fonsecaea multimorphosa CBS 102226]OAL22586.1 hypothetical protein AYO22_07144 [Fonsecaea multimorphosa]
MAIPSPPSSVKVKKKGKAPRRNKAKRSLKSTRPPLIVAGSSKAQAKAKKATAKTGPGPGPGPSAPSSSAPPSSSSLSSKHTRALINTHHLLQKRLAHARSTTDVDAVREIEAQIAAQGGLKSYQLASRKGQSAERGGDSSRVLVRWLEGEIGARKAAMHRRRGSLVQDHDDDDDGGGDEQATAGTMKPASTPGVLRTPIRILEIGALSTQNALNVPAVTRVRRIDLRSSEEGIEEVDFMHLPLPSGDVEPPEGGKGKPGQGERGSEGYYDVLSLSLVLNYVPDPRQRGAMLKRTTLFFAPQSPSHSRSHRDRRTDDQGEPSPINTPPQLLPCLFLVLPSPCLHNSRYLTPQQLAAILNSLGYVHLHTKTTRKLHYSLWRFDGSSARQNWLESGGDTVFRKREINPGGGRNNFCIVLDNDDGDLES